MFICINIKRWKCTQQTHTQIHRIVSQFLTEFILYYLPDSTICDWLLLLLSFVLPLWHVARWCSCIYIYFFSLRSTKDETLQFTFVTQRNVYIRRQCVTLKFVYICHIWTPKPPFFFKKNISFFWYQLSFSQCYLYL